MPRWKTLLATLGLIAVIVLAVTSTVMRMRKPGIPDVVKGRVIEKFDAKTGKPIKRTFGEWLKLQKGKLPIWKNPETGEYTVVNPITCIHCKEKIPGPLLTDDILKKGPEAIEAVRRAYVCPKCGKNAGIGQARPLPAGGPPGAPSAPRKSSPNPFAPPPGAKE